MGFLWCLTVFLLSSDSHFCLNIVYKRIEPRVLNGVVFSGLHSYAKTDSESRLRAGFRPPNSFLKYRLVSPSCASGESTAVLWSRCGVRDPQLSCPSVFVHFRLSVLKSTAFTKSEGLIPLNGSCNQLSLPLVSRIYRKDSDRRSSRSRLWPTLSDCHHYRCPPFHSQCPQFWSNPWSSSASQVLSSFGSLFVGFVSAIDDLMRHLSTPSNHILFLSSDVLSLTFLWIS